MKWLNRFFLLLATLISVSLTVAYAQDVDLSAVNCAVLPDQILGQANTGYAGAANTGYAGALGDEIRDSDLEIVNATLISNLQYTQAGDEKVAIIIVDDFSSEDPVISLDWASASHGWLVQTVFDQMIAELPTATADLIIIETLDLAGGIEFRSDLLAMDLETLMNDLNTSEGITKFVINMSFVFVACEEGGFNHAAWLQNREANPDLSLIEETGSDIDYVEQILSDPSVGRMSEKGFDKGNSGQGSPPEYVQQKLLFLNLFEVSKMNNDPLRTLFMQNSTYTIIPIAAAGNFKWKRPFFPAQWPEVLSVSATQGDSTDLWSLSNNGEISAPGAYFLFDDNVYRAGTSFAAPVVSLMTAIDLTNTLPTCSIANNGRPELGSNGRWDDVAFVDAVNDRC
jgi:hypothetical protein